MKKLIDICTAFTLVMAGMVLVLGEPVEGRSFAAWLFLFLAEKALGFVMMYAAYLILSGLREGGLWDGRK